MVFNSASYESKICGRTTAMNQENFTDELKEADEVADGMIPDSQIVHILDQILSAKHQQKSMEQPVNEQGLAQPM